MKKIVRTVLVVLPLLCLLALHTEAAVAGSASSPRAGRSSLGWLKSSKAPSKAAAAPYLVIGTTGIAGSVEQALTDHGITFTSFGGEDWSGLDLSVYQTVVIGMDGGLISTASVQNVADFAQNGGCLIIIGGSAWQEWATAVDTYLLANDTANYAWATSSTPHLTVTDPGNPLAAGLPGTYTFANSSASYYQIKSTDPAASVAAVNGDGYDILLSKDIGAGSLIWFVNSAEESYWANPADYNILSTIIGNALNTCNPAPVPAMGTWGLLILAVLLAVTAFFSLKRRSRARGEMA